MNEFLPLLEKILNQPYGWIGVTLVILLFGVQKLAEKTVIRLEVTHKYDLKVEELKAFFEAAKNAFDEKPKPRYGVTDFKLKDEERRDG